MNPRYARSRWPIAVLTSALFGCSPGRLNAIDLAPGTLGSELLAHYTFDEDAGTNVADHSGQKRNGTLTGTPAWLADGRFAGALHLDGMSYVTVPNFPNAPASFSVSAWVRTTNSPSDAGLQTVASTEIVFDAGWQLNVDKVEGGANIQAAFWDRDAGNYTYYDCPCLPDNAWTHAVFVVDAAAHTLSVYVNGHLAGVTPAPDPISPGAPSLCIGCWSRPGRLLVGDVDDIAIYGRALAPSEILLLDQESPPDVP